MCRCALFDVVCDVLFVVARCVLRLVVSIGGSCVMVVVCYVLCVDCCFADPCLVRCSLFVACCLLNAAACCLWYVVCWLLIVFFVFIVSGLLFVDCCKFPAVSHCSLLSIVRCALCVACC